MFNFVFHFSNQCILLIFDETKNVFKLNILFYKNLLLVQPIPLTGLPLYLETWSLRNFEKKPGKIWNFKQFLHGK